MTKKLVNPKKLVGKSSEKTMFKPAKYDKYADMVSIESPQEARKSANRLEAEFDSAKTKDKMVRISRAVMLARNRAQASLRRKDLSYKERNEFRDIFRIYDALYGRLSAKYRERFPPKPTNPAYNRTSYRRR